LTGKLPKPLRVVIKASNYLKTIKLLETSISNLIRMEYFLKAAALLVIKPFRVNLKLPVEKRCLKRSLTK
jgi:hypothetical protein